jgi:hypothetical protein
MVLAGAVYPLARTFKAAPQLGASRPWWKSGRPAFAVAHGFSPGSPPREWGFSRGGVEAWVSEANRPRKGGFFSPGFSLRARGGPHQLWNRSRYVESGATRAVW